MNVYQRKLYAFLQHSQTVEIAQQLPYLQTHLSQLENWWNEGLGKYSQEISSASDRVNLNTNINVNNYVKVSHPISGESQEVKNLNPVTADDIATIIQTIESLTDSNNPELSAKRIFWWCWRFLPEILASKQRQALLFPAHKTIPDSPIHSYNTTVSAIAGAMFPDSWQVGETAKHPDIFLFTFSPVQEFIKASRKFLDFWAGSYLLHYLSVKVCWYIASEYGADAVVVPSLWNQEIIDALLLEEFADCPTFEQSLKKYTQSDPVTRFNNKQSTSLTTAGFPNVITALIPQDEAKALAQRLTAHLKQSWTEIGNKIRQHIKTQVIEYLKDDNKRENFWLEFASELPSNADKDTYLRDLEKWQQHGCWEWNKLWDAQLNHSWETYWAVMPLGSPKRELAISKDSNSQFDCTWKAAQENNAPSRSQQPIPTAAEEATYHSLNVGTWWGNVQFQLGRRIQAVKNTRTWEIPAAPGERSTLSGQYSAVHPNLLYNEKFKEGGGLPAGSMQLFWRLMAQVYPGLFNGAEKLNAIELTKRMAWGYGGVAESLGIIVAEDIYEQLIRFPNLSSIASARFAHDNPQQLNQYRRELTQLIDKHLPAYNEPFRSRAYGRPFHVPKTDAKLNPYNEKGKDSNGVMFSSKWLAEDLGCIGEDIHTLRSLVDTAHRNTGFGDSSPSDWWAIALADGDNMGKYVSGVRLKSYQHYIVTEEVDKTGIEDQAWQDLLNTKKRMGPATHVGLNRALLDFSNRLVPYITEQRFCGKVVYSGGDDVMAVLPLADLPEYILSIRAAWCGGQDPWQEFKNRGDYWYPQKQLKGLSDRPHFTMGKDATMSMGIVIAHKSVPLPTVLENLWEAEKYRAKKIPGKDGLCFCVIYGGGNVLEAVMKGTLLESWYSLLQPASEELSPLLYRLAEELPRRAIVTPNSQLFAKAAAVIINRRDESKKLSNFAQIEAWLNDWEDWAKNAPSDALGTQPEDLGKLLRFSAFWVDKMVQQSQWVGEVS